MLKTIKITKQLRLDELIKYIAMNAYKLLDDKESYTFRSETGHEVIIDRKGNVNFDFMLYTDEDLFTIEIEEEITEDTVFDELYTLMKFKNVYRHDAKTINEVKECFKFSGEFELLHQIYAMIDGKLELVWECEEQ